VSPGRFIVLREKGLMSVLALRKLLGSSRVTQPVPDRAIDLVHLSRQSLGDRALEKELLQLFDRQAEQIIARLDSEIGAGDRRWRRGLSHTLAGSAKAVGALRVAQTASAYEEALFSSASDRELKILLANMASEVSGARETIRELLADA
jgi:HPt (histidine-containing phosphotransfer) domain-containing protein